MPNLTIDNWEEKFNEEFVQIIYPFLGGQRNYLKNLESKDDEMKFIEQVKQFISTILTTQKEEIRREIENYENTADEHVEPNEVHIVVNDILSLSSLK